MTDALERGQFARPLVVGDRLDTDIAGATATGLPSLMVLTGVNTARDAVFAVPEQRPTYLGADLRALHRGAETVAIAAHPSWRVTVEDTTVTVACAAADATGDPLAVVRAVARAVWDAAPGDTGARSWPATTPHARRWTAGRCSTTPID